MPTEFDELIPEFAEMIAEFGRDYTLTVFTDSGDHVAGGVPAGQITAQQTVKGTPAASFNMREIDGSAIQVGDMKTTISAQGLTLTPDTGMTVTFSGQAWRCVRVIRIDTGELTGAYTLHLRRA